MGYLQDDVQQLYDALIQFSSTPELYKLVKFVAGDHARPYWDMADVVDIEAHRDDWEAYYYNYPSAFTQALEALENYYETAMTINPDNYPTDPYYRPDFIFFFLAIVLKQKEFVLQFLNAYISATRSHQECMYNDLLNTEQTQAIEDSVYGVAQALWDKSP